MDVSGLGRFLVLAGVALALVGLLLVFAGKIPFVGRLPGDIVIKKGSFTVYFPIVTCLVISLLLTLIMRLLGRR